MVEFLASNDFWAILLKALITALVTGLVGLVCTSLGKLIVKCKNSKLRHHAKIAVEAAEGKFPNEGKKMGPEKMAYVMDYLAITFPKIKSNQYLYNIAEAAVYELNNEKIKKEAEQAFKDKYGELPSDACQDNTEAKEQQAASVIESVEINVNHNVSKEPSSFNLKSF